MPTHRWITGFSLGAALIAAGIVGSGACRAVSSEPVSTPKAVPAPEPTAALDVPTAEPIAAPVPATAGSRVVLLGFDGASHNLAEQFIAEGRMPWCKKLMEGGSFLPLGSANPAESPVAWASVNTGMNPGKTNIFGFIRRNFLYYADGKGPGSAAGMVLPTIGYNRDAELPWKDGTMPSHKNDLSAPNFWDRLDAAGVESRVLQAACNFPATGGEHTHLLAGLSVPDVRGGPGTYLVYTNSEWEFPRSTGNGGEVNKFKVVCPKCKNKSFTLIKGCAKCNPGKKPEELAPDQKIGWFETKLKGPDNFVERKSHDDKIAGLGQRLAAAAEGSPEKQQFQKELNAAKNAKKQWEAEKGNASVPLAGWVDRGYVDDKGSHPGSIKFQVGGQEFTVLEGEWSPYVGVNFSIDGAFPVKGTAHLHVLQCNPKAEDVRFYLPAITAAADGTAPNMPVTSPVAFGKELVGDVGLFDTIGWSCQTHALKDEEIGDQSFVTAIWDTIQWRRKMLVSQLDKPDWRVLFQVFGETDRVCHMMYRYFDEKHPQYKAEDALEKKVKFGPREVRLKDVIPAVYEEVDATIGLVLDRIEKGTLGDCTLMVCSDHGFSPFREEVEVNAWLIQNGFMTLAMEEGKPTTNKFALGYVDWSKTKAYSVGIGTIYINLEGREPEGIVPKEDVVVDGKVTRAGYDRVCDEILAKMKEYKNPNPNSPNDPQVFKGAWKRSQYLSGPFAADLRGDVTVNDPKAPGGSFILKNVCTEGAADIQVGFNFGYRIGWGTAMGDRAKDSPVFNNKNKWSGDHTSVHPNLVRGIFFCSRKVADGTMPQLQDLAPTILALEGVAVTDDVDGRILALPGLEELAKKHVGGTANRESLVAPEW